ncbi:adenylyl-sulfate kinase, partial [[Eubacterium] cellulosolvens]
MNGWAIWITGLPGSGKSTIAATLELRLRAKNISFQLLSIDMLRKIVTPTPIYSENERDLVYGSLVFTAYLLTLNGINVVIDATGNRRRYREQARHLIKRFYEVYVKCPLDLCIEREGKRKKKYGAPEKIYEKGLSKESTTVPGLGVPYEEPINPEVII